MECVEVKASLCKKCLHYWVDWNNGDRCCRKHGFKPNNQLPTWKYCRDFTPESRKEGEEK